MSIDDKITRKVLDKLNKRDDFQRACKALPAMGHWAMTIAGVTQGMVSEAAKAEQPDQEFDRNKAMNAMAKAHALFEYPKNKCSECNGDGREPDDTPCSNPNERAICKRCDGTGYWQRNPTHADRWSAAMDALAPYLKLPVREAADVNACGVWCPNCGAHLEGPPKRESGIAIKALKAIAANPYAHSEDVNCAKQALTDIEDDRP